MLKEIRVKTSSRVEFKNIDSEIQKVIDESKVNSGVCHIFVPHTTAAVTINENADPNVVRDIISETNKIIPFNDNYTHLEGNAAAHIKASLIGQSETVFIENGRMILGTWQSIFFCEFDGPRTRKVYVKIT
ncbi:YjbQ family protein [candidate division KSB1 bacterium]|nr:MAG: YjbQ family protein [candidate division KSB1 bacterium]